MYCLKFVNVDDCYNEDADDNGGVDVNYDDMDPGCTEE